MVQVVIEYQERALCRRRMRHRLAVIVKEERVPALKRLAAFTLEALAFRVQVQQRRQEGVAGRSPVAAVVVGIARVGREVALVLTSPVAGDDGALYYIPRTLSDMALKRTSTSSPPRSAFRMW